MTAFKRIVFAGTPDFAATILQGLLAKQWPITAVYSQPDRPAGRGRKLQASAVKQVALEYDLPVYQPHTLRKPEAQAELQALQPDLFIVVAYGLILPPAVLAIPRDGCINVHASLLPRWRGAAPIQRAILAGDQETGVSIMQMDKGLDTGPVYHMENLNIEPEMTSAQLHDALALLGAKCLDQSLRRIADDKLTPIAQVTNGVTYAEKISKDEALINWQSSAQAIARQVRAFNPWPVAFTHLNDQRLRIWQAQAVPAVDDKFAPGCVDAVGSDYVSVATVNGSLQIQRLQLAGGKMISVQDLQNAKPDFFKLGQQLT